MVKTLAHGMPAPAATRSPHVSIERRSSRQLRTGQSIQADALLGSHECQIAMDQRRDAHTELAAIVFLGQRHRYGLAARLHIGHYVGHHFLDTLERRLRRFGQPTQRSKFGAQADVFAIGVSRCH